MCWCLVLLGVGGLVLWAKVKRFVVFGVVCVCVVYGVCNWYLVHGWQCVIYTNKDYFNIYKKILFLAVIS
jgi:hypothetical protein